MRFLLASTILFTLALSWSFAQPERETLAGVWKVLEYDQNGTALPPDLVKKMKVTIDGDKIVIKPRIVVQYKPIFDSARKNVEVTFNVEADKSDEIRFKLDAAKERIDLVWRSDRGEPKTTRGIYLLEADTLRICFALADKNRPKKFPDAPKTGLVRMVLQRQAE